MSRVRLELGVVEVEGPEHTDDLADTARLLWWETQGGRRPGVAYAGPEFGFGPALVEEPGQLGAGRLIEPRARGDHRARA